MKPIILIGYMGAGKTTVGQLLADHLSLSFMDTDSRIEEQEKRSIRAIFAQDGEESFRDMETALLENLLEHKLSDVVLSVGGGLPIREKNRELLKELGTVVYLTAWKETIIERVAGSENRPLLQGQQLSEKVERMLKERDPLYRQAAAVLIKTDGKTVQEIVQEIEQSVVMGRGVTKNS